MAAGSFRDVDIRQLRALVAVAETGTFGRAAERLGFTQSAVSQQVAALEKRLGVALFDRPRGPRPPELTPAGELVLAHAHAVLARLDRAADELDLLQRGEQGRLDIGTFQSVSANLLPAVLGRLRHERPKVEIRLREDDCNDALTESVLDDELDLAFLVDTGELHPGLAVTVLAADPYVLLVPAGTGPASGVQPLAELHAADLIGAPEDNVCQLLVERALVGHEVTPEWVFRTIDNGAAQAMVRNNMGMAIMPRLAVSADDPGVDIVEIDPPIPPRTLVLAHRAGRTLHPAARQFLALAQEVAAAYEASLRDQRAATPA